LGFGRVFSPHGRKTTGRRKNSEEIRDILNGALEPEELAIVQKTLDRIAEAFTT
jgi:hypothetical protein